MEIIDLKTVSTKEFCAYFYQLNRFQKTNFVQQRKSEIAHLENPDILCVLCEEGYFIALLPLIKTGDVRSDRHVICFFAPNRRPALLPCVDDEREIVKYAATRMNIVRFLREETPIFSGQGHKRVPVRYLVYQYATQEVTDYLFSWVTRMHWPIQPVSGIYLFSRASCGVIRNYVKKVGCFSGKTIVSYSMLKGLAQREDIEAEDKHELLLLTVNRMYVRYESIHRLRQEGLLDF